MALDIYYREDVARVLAALDVSSEGSVAVVNEEVERAARERVPIDGTRLEGRLRDFRAGYELALRGVALAFGVVPRTWSTLGGVVVMPPGAELLDGSELDEIEKRRRR